MNRDLTFKTIIVSGKRHNHPVSRPPALAQLLQDEKVINFAQFAFRTLTLAYT
jgi:hypothetical protein